MRAHLLTFALVASVAACGPKDLPREEITEVLFPSKGLLAGYDFGDSWQDIKAKPPEHFAVRDDDTKQLRRDVGDNAGSNGYYVGFGLDDAGKVKSLSVHISGKKQNAVTVRALLDDVIAHYDKTIGGGRCSRTGTKDNSSNCSWEAPGKPRIRVTYHEMLDLQSGSLEVSLTPPK
ncbi:MAG: hypothetical protein JNL21_25280 [Myxococcales bacterium]|nr:hypothetical protein [Myxococcales bacterium]